MTPIDVFGHLTEEQQRVLAALVDDLGLVIESTEIDAVKRTP